jgi:hypothetical protein
MVPGHKISLVTRIIVLLDPGRDYCSFAIRFLDISISSENHLRRFIGSLRVPSLSHSLILSSLHPPSPWFPLSLSLKESWQQSWNALFSTVLALMEQETDQSKEEKRERRK